MLSLLVHGAIVLSVVASSAVCQTSTRVQSVQGQTIQVAGSAIEHQSVKQIELGQHVRIEKMRIPDGLVDLDLSRFSVLAPNAELVLGTRDGMEKLAAPDVVLLSGTVVGIPDSKAYIAVSPYATNGYIEIAGDLTSISTGPYAQEKNLLEALETARMADVIDPGNGPEVCGYTPGDTALEPFGEMIEMPASLDNGVTTCRIAGIAIETDWEYTNRLFGGDTNASAAYAISLMGAISEIYERDMNVRLSIPFLRVWGDNSDPYAISAGDPLDLVRNEWNSNMSHVNRTVVHYLTGRTDVSYGGVAYVGVLCNGGYGYGVSAHLDGSFPYPLVDHNGGNWDLVVASHELGHNFGTSHTHNYTPVIDGCGNGDCADSFGGTIMSYCHSCSGGLTNIVLEFHPRVQNTIVGYMDSIAGSCDLTGEGVSAVADSIETTVGLPVEIDAMSNDASQSCDSIALNSFEMDSANGGTIELLAGQGPAGRDMFRYTPADGFDGIDTFGYSITGSSGTQSATVTIDVRALRPADTRIDPIAGLRVKYYDLGTPSMLPNFDTLIPMSNDVSMGVDYASTSGEFMNSGLSDDVGAVFTGYVQVFFGGIYNFTTESDDGSALYVGDELVVNNDGLHGMVKIGGSIPLAAGWHKVRIEFFERGGGAGLFSTIVWPTGQEFLLADSYISHEASEACSIADINSDGTLNFFDISDFLDAFGNEDPIADFTGNGTFNFFDISEFLTEFGAGCP